MAAVQIIPIKVGVVLDMDGYGEMALTCISMALRDFYATHDHYKTRLVLTNRDSKGDVVGAAAAALDLLKNVEVQAIIGPMFSYQANFLIALGHKAQVPIITFSATTPLLTSLRSPYFIRTTLNDSSQVDAIVAIIQAFGWREVVQIYEDNEFGEGIIPYLTGALEKVNIRVPYRSAISPLATDDQIVAELNKLTSMQTRVFVVHMLSPLASRLFTKAKQLGMMSREYAWIITDGVTNELKSMDQFVKESMLGVIGVKPYVPKTKELDDFAIRYKEMVQKKSTPDFDIFGLWAYDSAIALAMAAEKAIVRNPTYRKTNISRNSTELEAIGVSETGPKLIQALSTTTFKGLAGEFKLVHGQLQGSSFQIINMVGPGDRGIGYWTKDNGIVRELNFTSANKKTYSTSKSNLGSIIWPGDVSSPPKGWEIPTNGKKLRVGVPVKDGFTEFMHVNWNSDNSTNVEGYCKDIFDAVMAALPYHVPYEYIPFATPDHKMAGDYNDLVYQVHLKNYDAVAGDITIIANRSQYIDFTLPYTDSGERVVSNLARFVLIIWFLVVFILTQSYTASLSSMLTVQKLQPKVTDVNELINNKDYVGYSKGSFVYGFLKKMKFDDSQLIAYESPEQLDELLSKGSGNGGIAAAFDGTPFIKLFFSKYCSKYTTAGQTYKADGFGFVCYPPSIK
ncbi:hypothetical protein DH2020_025326 [Rehmannia glutinosa]|uniref:Ionotropic glutamate receptor C-terminal domain-containing protein n=1 Tax=Rehmannia glutinosa TaxID=99300 RepID=A0ABR0W006_REHGL